MTPEEPQLSPFGILRKGLPADELKLISESRAVQILARCGAEPRRETIEGLVYLTAVATLGLKLEARAEVAVPEWSKTWRRELKALAADPARTLNRRQPALQEYLEVLRLLAEADGIDLERHSGIIWAGDTARKWLEQRGKPGRKQDRLHERLIEHVSHIAGYLALSPSLGESEKVEQYEDGSLPAPPTIAFLMSFVEAVRDTSESLDEPEPSRKIRETCNKRLRSHRERLSAFRSANSR